MEDNQKAVNKVLLKMRGYEADTLNTLKPPYRMTSQDSTTLANVAYQNPALGGTAVYQARQLLWIDVADDLTVTAKRAIPKKTEENGPNYKLFPNPNNGIMTLEYHTATEETVVFGIYTIEGKLVKSKTLNIKNNSIEINAEELNAGVYYYEIKEGGKRVKTQKLVIVK
jgi:hypothetical protein